MTIGELLREIERLRELKEELRLRKEARCDEYDLRGLELIIGEIESTVIE